MLISITISGVDDNNMKILYLTNMYPIEYGSYYGIFVKKEIEELRKLGLTVDFIFINGRKRKINYLNLFSILRKMKEKYELVNVHHSLLLPHALFAKKFLNLNIPIVFTLHEGELGIRMASENILEQFFHSKLWRKPLLQRINLVIAKNEETLEKIGSNVKRIEIPTAVDTKIFKPIQKEKARNKLNIRNNGLTLFFPADKYRPGKNYSFIENLLPDIEKRIGKSVILLSGPKPYDEMMWYYNATDVVVFPSLYECSPVVIKEAMACNIPLVASDVGDIRRVVGNTEGCFIIDEWNKDAYVNKIIEANNIKRTEGRKRMFKLGCDWSQTAKKIGDVLLDIIECNYNNSSRYVQ